jgi:hypothetical protein
MLWPASLTRMRRATTCLSLRRLDPLARRRAGSFYLFASGDAPLLLRALAQYNGPPLMETKWVLCRPAQARYGFRSGVRPVP